MHTKMVYKLKIIVPERKLEQDFVNAYDLKETIIAFTNAGVKKFLITVKD